MCLMIKLEETKQAKQGQKPKKKTKIPTKIFWLAFAWLTVNPIRLYTELCIYNVK